MKSVILSILLLVSAIAITFDKSKLNIFIFHVGQADSQLIRFPSGYTVMIDLGENRDDLNPKNSRYVAEQLKSIVPSMEIDVLVLSHIHLDHFGYVPHNGIYDFIENSGFTVKKYISRSIGEFTGENRDDCNNETINWKYVGEYETYNVDWICYANSIKNQTKLSKVMEYAKICSKSQIQPPDEHAEVQIVMVDALKVKRMDGTNVADNWKDTLDAPSENDYSIALRVQYNDFVYYTGGDLDGSSDKIYGYEICNSEAVCKDIIGSVDVYRANHHGDDHSSSEDFLNVLKPSVGIISCGKDNHYGLPYYGAVERLSRKVKNVYLTESCNDLSRMRNNFYKMDDDIIITVNDNNSYSIRNGEDTYYRTYLIKHNKPERAKCEDVFDGYM